MARLESQAVAGYFPTPERMVRLIADHLKPEDESEVRVCDPCAGDGAAVFLLCTLLGVRTSVYACELEQGRYEVLVQSNNEHQGWNYRERMLHGDAFRVMFEQPWCGLLYLNPPYDTDPEHGRLEQRFLERFHGVLVEGGVLAFVVPHYALTASAELLALDYDELECYRFPEPEVSAYKQVVLFARRVDSRFEPDRKLLRKIERWASPEGFAVLPELGESPKPIRVPSGEYIATKNWQMRPIDMAALLAKARPWCTSSRGGQLEKLSGVLPELGVDELMFRRFPVATAPRPAHIAAGIASGLFNGCRVRAKKRGLPDLLVKGVFEREYVTVEEKTDRGGMTSSVVQVQQPKLVVVVLDLSSGRYHELKPGALLEFTQGNGTESATLEGMSLEGLLEHYGPDLLRVMNEQCPVIYNPERDRAGLPLAPLVRELFDAQADAARAILKLLGGASAKPYQRRGKAAILLGEIGVGKTSVVLSVASSFARRVLVMCPPHLLDSWTNETHAVVPGAQVRVLSTVDHVDDFAAEQYEGVLVGVLSREAAKLGHGYVSVRKACPSCGARVPKGNYGRSRGRCQARPLRARDALARAAVTLAQRLAPCAPDDERVIAMLPGRLMRRMLVRYRKREQRKPWPGFDPRWVSDALVDALGALSNKPETASKLLGMLLLADYDPERIHTFGTQLRQAKNSDWRLTQLGASCALLLPPGELQESLRDGSFEWMWKQVESEDGYTRSVFGEVHNLPEREPRLPTINKAEPGSLELALLVLAKLMTLGDLVLGTECDEPLHQAVPEPRRYPLARYIARRHPKAFDLLVLDEAHEYSTSGDSAQSHAAQRLAVLGMPIIEMTGSVMNGYAKSLFTTFQIVSPSFREEFKRSEVQRFVDRYGYRKRVLTDRDKETRAVVEFGSHTDRVVRSEREACDAPGVLPLFIFRHLLACSVTLHKADLSLQLPPCRQFNEAVDPGPKLLRAYRALESQLAHRIRTDMFVEGRSGKLFGQLSELPSYLDRATADVGNREGGGPYIVDYPESCGSERVAVGECFPATTILPKEKWVLDKVAAELDEGRNVMVFTWHTELLLRLKRVLERRFKIEAPVLHADKVPTHKRQAWIDREIVAKGRRLMVANPVTVQTGLNNLVHFNTEVWHENPACNPIAFRQPIGRVDRIGAKKETRIFVPYYAGTLQQAMHSLLMRKVAVSIATDGLDPESVLIASGGSEDAGLAGLSLGRQLWAILNQQGEAAAE